MTVAPGSARAPEEAAVNLEVVRYPALVEQVRAQRGKILVVDIWGEF